MLVSLVRRLRTTYNSDPLPTNHDESEDQSLRRFFLKLLIVFLIWLGALLAVMLVSLWLPIAILWIIFSYLYKNIKRQQ